jgi:hypothetical protein
MYAGANMGHPSRTIGRYGPTKVVPLLWLLRWSPTGYDAHQRLMFEHFAGISLANAFFDERAMIFVKRRVLGHILVGRGLSHKTYCIRLSALMEIM